MFWHPMLTFYQTFHTNLSSFTRVNINYKLVSIFNTNVYRITRNIIVNLVNIVTKRDQYASSKANLEKGLQQIGVMLNGK